MVAVALSGIFLFVCFICFKLKSHGVLLQYIMLLDFSSLIMYKEFQALKSGPFTEVRDL